MILAWVRTSFQSRSLAPQKWHVDLGNDYVQQHAIAQEHEGMTIDELSRLYPYTLDADAPTQRPLNILAEQPPPAAPAAPVSA